VSGGRRRTYLFVLCPAFSGSTVLYRLLASSRHASALFGHGNWAGEGQFVPAVRSVMRRQPGPDPRIGGWEDPRVTMPWARIRRAWERCWDLSKPVLIEKSPPNLLRAPAIEGHFSRYGDVRFVAMVRSPYCVRQRPRLWIEEARHQRRNVTTLRHVVWTTYEALCADAAAVADRLTGFLPALGRLDPAIGQGGDAGGGASVGEPDRDGPIVARGGTTRSLALLRNRELAAHEDLLRFFGYRLLTPGSEEWERQPWLPEIELRSTLSAPPARVYRAWVDPRWLCRWWGRVRVDARVGGEYSLHPYGGDDGRAFPLRGRYLALEPGRRIRFTWDLSVGDYRLDDSTVEVELRSAGTGCTELSLRSLAVARSWYDDNEEFWRRKLVELEDVVATNGGKEE